jgi:hypothetical protein
MGSAHTSGPSITPEARQLECDDHVIDTPADQRSANTVPKYNRRTQCRNTRSTNAPTSQTLTQTPYERSNIRRASKFGLQQFLLKSREFSKGCEIKRVRLDSETRLGEHDTEPTAPEGGARVFGPSLRSSDSAFNPPRLGVSTPTARKAWRHPWGVAPALQPDIGTPPSGGPGTTNRRLDTESARTARKVAPLSLIQNSHSLSRIVTHCHSLECHSLSLIVNCQIFRCGPDQSTWPDRSDHPSLRPTFASVSAPTNI